MDESTLKGDRRRDRIRARRIILEVLEEKREAVGAVEGIRPRARGLAARTIKKRNDGNKERGNKKK
jgi:hypothetical protein